MRDHQVQHGTADATRCDAASIRKQQIATAAVFFVTGLVSATWAARIPAVQARLHLSSGALGLAVLAIEGGAVLGLPAGGWLVSWLGSQWSLRLGFTLYPTVLVLLAVVPSLAWLAAALLVWAAANSVIDVAMNSAGVAVQRRLRRPTLSRLHAAQSGGLLTGGFVSTITASTAMPLLLHFAIIGAVGVLGAAAATTRLPAGATTARRPPVGRPERPLLLLGLVAFCAFLIDGGAGNWAAVYLRTERHASPALAAAGYTVFTVAMALARLAGDWTLAHLCRSRLVQASGLTAAAGAVLVICGPTAALAILGWAITGIGLATLAPTVLGAAPEQARHTPPAAAIATVTTLGYLGSFTGPPAIGALAEPLGLPTALGVLAAAGAAVSLLAPIALPIRSADGQSRQRR